MLNLTDMDKEKDIKQGEGVATVHPVDKPARRHLYVWVAVVLAVVAWMVLLWSNGYVALAVAILSCIAGFWGASRSDRNMKRLAIAAIIAAMVLVVVLAAFLIVLKIGLST